MVKPTGYETTRRNFMKGVAALFAAAPILPSLNLISRNIGETDDLAVKRMAHAVPVVRQQATQLMQKASFADIIEAINNLPLMASRYGFSYDQIFEKVLLEAGNIPEFPLDFYSDYPRSGLTRTNITNPVVFTDKEKNICVDDQCQDYLLMHTADFQGKPARFEVRPDPLHRWDRVSLWVQEMQHNFQLELAKTAWSCILEAGNQSVRFKTDFSNFKKLVSTSRLMMGRHHGRLTDIYVPTHTYQMVDDYIRNSLVNDLKNDHKFEWHMKIERDIFNLNQPIRMFGINIRHAPELSWWYPEEHIGVGVDLASRDSFVQIQRSKPTMFHKAITPYESEGFVWNEEGFGILNSCKVMLIHES